MTAVELLVLVAVCSLFTLPAAAWRQRTDRRAPRQFVPPSVPHPTPTPSSSFGSADTTLCGNRARSPPSSPPRPTEPPCSASCAVILPPLTGLGWSSFVPTTTLTAATVTIVRDGRTNESSTVTSYVDLPPPYRRPKKLPDGTVISAVKIFASAGVIETVLTYPTHYTDYGAGYTWTGALPTRDGNLSVCTTAKRASLPFPSHPPLSVLQPPQNPYVYPQDDSKNPVDGDRLGDNYALVSTAFSGSLDYASIFPSQPVLKLCQPTTSPFANGRRQTVIKAAYITVTTTTIISGGTQQTATIGPSLGSIRPPPLKPEPTIINAKQTSTAIDESISKTSPNVSSPSVSHEETYLRTPQRNKPEKELGPIVLNPINGINRPDNEGEGSEKVPGATGGLSPPVPVSLLGTGRVITGQEGNIKSTNKNTTDSESENTMLLEIRPHNRSESIRGGNTPEKKVLQGRMQPALGQVTGSQPYATERIVLKPGPNRPYNDRTGNMQLGDTQSAVEQSRSGHLEFTQARAGQPPEDGNGTTRSSRPSTGQANGTGVGWNKFLSGNGSLPSKSNIHAPWAELGNVSALKDADELIAAVFPFLILGISTIFPPPATQTKDSNGGNGFIVYTKSVTIRESKTLGQDPFARTLTLSENPDGQLVLVVDGDYLMLSIAQSTAIPTLATNSGDRTVHVVAGPTPKTTEITSNMAPSSTRFSSTIAASPLPSATGATLYKVGPSSAPKKKGTAGRTYSNMRALFSSFCFFFLFIT